MNVGGTRGMRRILLGSLTALTMLGGCSLFGDDEAILPGERIPVRQASDEKRVPPEIARDMAPLGPALTNADWTQPGAISTRAPGHLAGPSELREIWRADAGAGSDSSGRITSTPVVADGRVFTLDSEGSAAAFDAGSGREIWRASLVPEDQYASDGFGGGVAYMDGRVFVTTGFGEVTALSAVDGGELWRQKLGAPMRAAPAADAGRVVVVTRDNSGFALDAASGEILWRVQGAAGGAGVVGGASPAISGELAALPFASGEIVAVRASNGRRLWSDALTGGRRGLARGDIADITGGPVIAGLAVFAANQSGLTVAIDGRSGRRGWLRQMGATSPMWPLGATLFMIDDRARLMRLAANTGESIWSVDLPEFEDPEDRSGLITYAGPIVAGDRLFLTSSEGELLVFDPLSGERIGSVDLPDGSSTGPIVAGGVLFVLADDGTLVAFR